MSAAMSTRSIPAAFVLIRAATREGQFVVYQLNVSVWRQVADGFFDHLLQGEDAVTLQNFRVERLPVAGDA